MVEKSHPPADDPSNEAIYSGAGPDDRDPKPLHNLLKEVVDEGFAPSPVEEEIIVTPLEALELDIDSLRTKRRELIDRKRNGDSSVQPELDELADELAALEARYAELRYPPDSSS